MARTKKAEVVKNVKENREPETLEEFTKIICAFYRGDGVFGKLLEAGCWR